MKCNKKK